MKAKHWLITFFILLFAALFCAAALVVYVDPFFHYHAPHTDKFFYTIDNQRSANDGIAKHFDYDAIITGSSMTANFSTSELDALFGTNSVKLTAAGASFYEIDSTVRTAFEHNPALKYVFRSVDRNLLIYGSSERRDELGEFPDYLYDDNIFNDYKYVLNADVIFGRVMDMLLETREPGFAPGHTSFDEYSNTMKEYEGTFGLENLRSLFLEPLGSIGQPQHLSEEQRQTVAENVYQNLVATAEAHPEATFYYFLPPYSLGFWHDRIAWGDIYAQFEAEQIAIELMLQCDNIKLFDFTARHDIISDVNNYRDLLHYGDWINSFILKWMHEEQYMLTGDNYKDFLARQMEYYSSYDYSQLLEQPRYNCDYYAAALLNEELCGISPRPITEDELLAAELRHAELIDSHESDRPILRCSGTLGRSQEQDLAEFLLWQDFAGMKLYLEDGDKYSFLCFKGRNTGHNGQPAVFAYDETGRCIASVEMTYHELSGGWQIFVVDLRDAKGPVEVIFNGAYTDYTGHSASGFEFKDFMLY